MFGVILNITEHKNQIKKEYKNILRNKCEYVI